MLRKATFLAIALVGITLPAGAFAAPHLMSTSTKSAQTKITYASQAHPVLAIPGDLIDVTLKTGVTQIQIVGPKVPQIAAEALPGTFTFSFNQLKGATVIDIHDFGILDGNATVIRPVKFDDGTTKLTLKAGHHKTFSLTEIMAVGTGTLRWAPLNHYVADWQFVEETA